MYIWKVIVKTIDTLEEPFERQGLFPPFCIWFIVAACFVLVGLVGILLNFTALPPLPKFEAAPGIATIGSIYALWLGLAVILTKRKATVPN